MSFTIKCDECGTEQKLDEKNLQGQDKIVLTVCNYMDPWEALEIECKQCKNLI